MKKLGNFGDKIQASKVAKKRVKYGVHLTDTWSLDHHLSRIIGNGLVLLADNLHGAPPGYPNDDWGDHATTDFDGWKNDVRKYGEIFLKYSSRDDIHWEIHETIKWPKKEEGFIEEHNGHMMMKIPDESTEYGRAFNEWTKKCQEFDEQLDKEISEALKWFSQWFQALWD